MPTPSPPRRPWRTWRRKSRNGRRPGDQRRAFFRDTEGEKPPLLTPGVEQGFSEFTEMAHVVFLRAANVAGRNAFRPARVAADLAHLDVANVGAAGTFVVRGRATEAAIRREILARLPFEPEILVRPASEVLALVASDPFRGVAFSRDLRGWVAALVGRPKARPELPLFTPRGRD